MNVDVTVKKAMKQYACKKCIWNTGICGCYGDKTFNCYTKMLLRIQYLHAKMKLQTTQQHLILTKPVMHT